MRPPRLVVRCNVFGLGEEFEGDPALSKEGLMSQAAKDCRSGLEEQKSETLPLCGLRFVYKCK